MVKLVTPRLAPSRIGEYLVSLPAGAGTVRPVAPGFETFLYGLDGRRGRDRRRRSAVARGRRVRLPAGDRRLRAERRRRTGAAARAQAPLRAHPRRAGAGLLHGHRDDEPFAATPVPGFRRRELLPVDDPAFDFNMSLLAFDPGVGLATVEIHDEEHGLYMTAGGGVYLLEDERHEVARATSSTWRPTARSRSSPPATARRVPALQGRLARRLLSRAAPTGSAQGRLRGPVCAGRFAPRARLGTTWRD